MLIRSIDAADKKIIQVSGVIDYTVLTDFRNLLFKSMERSPSTVLLDMSAVTCINAGGIQVVLDLYEQYSQHHDISIINPSDDVNNLLCLTGLNNLMPIHDYKLGMN